MFFKKVETPYDVTSVHCSTTYTVQLQYFDKGFWKKRARDSTET